MPLVPISTRIAPELARRLEESANAAGKAVSVHVRDLLRGTLDSGDNDAARLRLEVAALTSQVELLRHDLANVVEALLVVVGSREPVTPEEARSWVDERLRKQSPSA